MTDKRRRSRSGYRNNFDIPLIGWREWVTLPALGVERIKAKIDTGARTSAIHAFNVRTLTDRGSPSVSFTVHPEQRRRRPSIECVAEIHDEREVRSSNGQRQRRYVILTPLDLGGRTWPIEMTLADRDEMGFRLLLGREAVRRHFVIDASRSFIAGRSFADIATVPAAKGKTA